MDLPRHGGGGWERLPAAARADGVRRVAGRVVRHGQCGNCRKGEIRRLLRVTTLLVLVSRPERTALEEAERTRAELAALGITNQRLILNGMFAARNGSDPVARALEARGRQALEEMAPTLQAGKGTGKG